MVVTNALFIYNKMVKYKTLIKLCWSVLLIYYILTSIFGNYIEILCNNQKFIEICNYCEKNIIINFIISFIMYYFNWIFIIYAILREKLNYKLWLFSILILLLFIIKFTFSYITIINYIDFLMCIPLAILLKKQWYRAVIGIILSLVFVIISTKIKGICITNYDPNELNLFQTIIYSIDVYIMCGLYYIYELRKERNSYGIQTCIFQIRKSMENYFSNIRNNFSRCFSGNCFISKIKQLNKKDLYFYYCSFVFCIITYISIILLAIFNNKVIEVTISIISFHILRRKDEKTFHASNDFMCWLISVISFSIISILEFNLSQSILSCICWAYILTQIMYYIQDYFDLKDRFKANKVNITKGMSKDKLLKICEDNNLNELETKILIYFYCDRLSLLVISRKIGYSYDYTAELKSKIIKSLKLRNTN